MISLTSYLTEQSLGEVLRAWAGKEFVISQPQVPGTRMRYDYEVIRNGKHMFVEFDGDSHFRDATVIFRDDTKDAIAKSLGKAVIRIPYFVQLDKESFKLFFGEGFDICTSFPHGFIAHKMLPASFCRIGLARADAVVKSLPNSIYEAIFKSLAEKARTLPAPFVYGRYAYAEDSSGKALNFEEWVAESVKVHGEAYDYSRSRTL